MKIAVCIFGDHLYLYIKHVVYFKQENLTFQNLLKNRNYNLQKKFWNILAFEEESKRKLLNLISVDNFIKNNNAFHFRVEIIIILKWKSFLISKNLIQILWICNCNKNLAIGYTGSAWYAGRLFMFTSNEIGFIV